ncbi:hypothetical protein Tco_0904609 [Tanacetum coccineum]
MVKPFLQTSRTLHLLNILKKPRTKIPPTFPNPDDIRRLLELERVMVDRTIKSQTVTLTPIQILTKTKPRHEAMGRAHSRELFGLEDIGPLPAFLHTSRIVFSVEQYNRALLALSKESNELEANPSANSSIGRFLTSLSTYQEAYPHPRQMEIMTLLIDHAPLLFKATQETHRKIVARHAHSVSSSSSHHHGTSSHQHDDDDDVETSRASTPSPTTYLNSLNPLNYQNYEMPSASEQTSETLFERQTTLLNQTQEMHKEMPEVSSHLESTKRSD